MRDICRGPARPDLIRNEDLACLLEHQAASAPDHIALMDGEQSLSYGQLHVRACHLAAQLHALGLGPGRIVGLWMPRGMDGLIAQAGIAMAGAAWLPFDADTPPDRVAECLVDAQAGALVAPQDWAGRVPSACANLVQPFEALASAQAMAFERQRAQPQDPAYVIYTSGSTGKPKGIAVSQGSICHFLRSENEQLGVCANDRVYQGFSLAFDMSFEEIWIAYLAGATLWIAPREVASNPELLPRVLQAQGITVLHAVPTLLALFEQDVPSLRLINLGGEMCPQALAERWAHAQRRVFNSYGPTEATVSASMAALQPGEPVTIGMPLPNYVLMVVDPESGLGSQALQLRPCGEIGELCISGPGVALGYLGRPDLTAEKFVANPWPQGPHEQRLYRTGDLARINAQGNIECLGRSDDQVKIRGFRVELGEIDAQLCRLAGVGTGAVVLREVDGMPQLLAYVVPQAEVANLPPSEFTSRLRAGLHAALPPYMVPSRFELLAEMPRLLSGKIDRKALLALPLQDHLADDASVPIADNAAQTVLFKALQTLFPGARFSVDSDFFDDLGGHSLFAARLTSLLRRDPRFARVSVRDVYAQRRVGAIAQAMQEQTQAATTPRPEFQRSPALRRWLCGLAQALAVPPLVTLRMAQWLAPFFTYHLYTGGPDDTVGMAVLLSLAAFMASTVLAFGVTIAGKWLVLGRAKAGRYPLWGWMYFRWWLADRLIEAAPTYMLPGSSLFSVYLRALGAKVGRDAQIGSLTLRVPDLLRIGDGASLGTAVNLENAKVEGGTLILGSIDIGANAYIGSFAVLEPGTGLGELAHLDGISALASGQHVPAGRVWTGSPARDAGAFDAGQLPPRPRLSPVRAGAEALYFACGSFIVAMLFFIPVFPAFMLIDWLDDADTSPWLQGDPLPVQFLKYFVLALPASAVLILLTALVACAIRWSVMPRIRAGRWPVHSLKYCQRWLVNQIQETSLQVLHGIYATVYAPNWYRMLGAKVGRDAEISTALGVVPDLLTLGDETFIADGVLLGDEGVDGGWVTVEATSVARRSFVGNGAYVPDGSALPENVLVGVHTHVPPNARMRSGDTWLGTPAVHLPAREQVSGFPEALTFRPSRWRRLWRGVVEALRIVSPHALVIAVGYTIVLNMMNLAEEDRWMTVALDLTLCGLLYALISLALVALLKWTLIGRYRQRAVPMWTLFVWLSEAVTNLYEGIAVPNFLRYLRGTPWLPCLLRLLGARIGRGVYLDTTDITEFDCVSIGEFSELNALSCPQTHLFEDRVMKIDHVHIGACVTMSARSSVLYGAAVEDRVNLGPLTLVMKGETIPAESQWHGCPACPVG